VECFYEFLPLRSEREVLVIHELGVVRVDLLEHRSVHFSEHFDDLHKGIDTAIEL